MIIILAILINAGFGWWLLNQTFDSETDAAVARLRKRGWLGYSLLFLVASCWFLIALLAFAIVFYRRSK